jgi:Xaa-Pro aminopeptidase
VDKVARDVIEKSGYGAEFIHSLGHGIGLEIHEPPSISQRSVETLEDGNIISDEPGIYLHGFGGVRIEDTILVTTKNPIKLTRYPRNLDEVVF